MKTSRMQLLAGALVLAALLAVSGASQASCGSSQRVPHSDVSCLEAGWNNMKQCVWGVCRKYSDFWTRSVCSGRVVAKVDIAGAPDRTWHHTYNGHFKSGNEQWNHVNGISCCRDLSDSGKCN